MAETQAKQAQSKLPQLLLVDGYNYLHTQQDLKSILEAKGMSEARQDLQRQLYQLVVNANMEVSTVR